MMEYKRHDSLVSVLLFNAKNEQFFSYVMKENKLDISLKW